MEVEATGKNLVPLLRSIAGVQHVEQVAPERYRLLASYDMRAAAARVVVNAGDLHHLSVAEPSLDAIYNRYFQKIAGSVEEQRDAA